MWHHHGGCHAHLNEKQHFQKNGGGSFQGTDTPIFISDSMYHFSGIKLLPSLTGLKMASRQNLKCEKTSILVGKSQENLEFELWRLAISKPV